jgi:hypothetical protein
LGGLGGPLGGNRPGASEPHRFAAGEPPASYVERCYLEVTPASAKRDDSLEPSPLGYTDRPQGVSVGAGLYQPV